MLRRLRRNTFGPSVPRKPAPPATTESSEAPEWPDIGFEERMATVEFRAAKRPHIVVDTDICRECTTRACVTACPADLFVPTADGGMVFDHEHCFECGLCYMVCDHEGAISWSYPEGGYGVVMRWS